MRRQAGDIRVLHVDDDPDLRAAAGPYLEGLDDRITTSTVASPAEGRERLASEDIDCIVSDYEMPETDGIEFLELVRETHPDLPFVLFTGTDPETVATDALAAGATDVVRKRCGTDQYELLANRVCRAVERSRLEREADMARDRFQAVAQSAGVGILIADPAGRIRYANPAIETQLGYAPAELRGEGLGEVVPAYGEASDVSADGGTPVRSPRQVQAKHCDGSRVAVSASFSQFRQDDVERVVAVLREVSTKPQPGR